MAVVSVAFDGTRLSEAETETDGGTWDDWGKTTSPTQETDFVYQNTYCISNKISGGTGGVDFDSTGTVNYTSPKRVVLAIVNITTYGLINTSVSKGAAYQIGSSGTAYDEWYIYGSGQEYPSRGGFQVLVIDPNVSGYRDAQAGGGADLTAVDYYGWWADITGAVKSDNVMHDSLSYITSGTGLTLTGGDGGDTDGTFDDFVSADEGTFDTGRWGVVVTGESEIVVNGTLTIGSATATEFTDSLKTVVFPDGRVDAGFFSIAVDLQNESSAVAISNCVFVSNGTQQPVTDTRARFDVSGTSGSAVIDACNFINFAGLTLRSTTTLSGCNVVNSEALDAYSATVTECVFDSPPIASGQAFAFTDAPDVFSSCEWISSGSGHGIRCDTIGTYDWTSNIDSGYTGTRGTNSTPNSGSTDAMFYNNSGGLITLNVSGAGGLQPSVRNGLVATTTVVASVPIEINGVTEGTRVMVIGSSGAQSGVVLVEGYANAAGIVSGSFSGATPQPVSIRARNAGIINAAILHDEGTGDTDYTDAARESAGTNDVVLLPATPATNDAFYYGGNAKFAEVLLNITTKGDTYVLTWEYWNGAWTALTVVDGTSSYTNLGWNKVSFTAPSDWSTTTFGGSSSLYYIRARVTTGGGTQPLAQNITLNKTVKYLSFNGAGSILASSGLTSTAVWLEDPNNP